MLLQKAILDETNPLFRDKQLEELHACCWAPVKQYCHRRRRIRINGPFLETNETKDLKDFMHCIRHL